MATTRKFTKIDDYSNIYFNPVNATPAPTKGVMHQPDPVTEPNTNPTKPDPYPEPETNPEPEPENTEPKPEPAPEYTIKPDPEDNVSNITAAEEASE